MEEMKTVLAKIQELYGALCEAMAFCNKQKDFNEKRAIELNAQEKAQIEKQVELDKREVKVKEVENIVELYEKGLALKKENETKEQALLKERNDIKEYAKKQIAIINEGIANNVKENERIKKEWGLINQEWIALKKAKENMRNDLIQEIMKSQIK